MKKFKGFKLLLLAALILSMSLLAGCVEEKSGSTISEPEITADYLQNEYAKQLTTDGAETMLGFVTIEKNGDLYNVKITEKRVIPDSDYAEGYYIADTNVIKDVSLGQDARIACMEGHDTCVVSADEFVSNNDSEQLYTVYLMGDSAELILATDPEEIITE